MKTLLNVCTRRLYLPSTYQIYKEEKSAEDEEEEISKKPLDLGITLAGVQRVSSRVDLLKRQMAQARLCQNFGLPQILHI